jgi:hypothetical protein
LAFTAKKKELHRHFSLNMSSQQRNKAAARHAKRCNARANDDARTTIDHSSGKTTVLRDLITGKQAAPNVAAVVVAVDPNEFDERAFASQIERLRDRCPSQSPILLLLDDVH